MDVAALQGVWLTSPSPVLVSPVGFYGLVDFTGIPVAAPPPGSVPTPTAGMYGLVDFTGIPTGVPTQVPVHGMGFRGAGRYTGLLLNMAKQQRQQQDAWTRRRMFHEMRDLVGMELLARGMVYQKELDRKHRQNVIYTTLLAEI